MIELKAVHSRGIGLTSHLKLNWQLSCDIKHPSGYRRCVLPSHPVSWNLSLFSLLVLRPWMLDITGKYHPHHTFPPILLRIVHHNMYRPIDAD